jgi:ABC-type multidrug transport system ATPase subunit
MIKIDNMTISYDDTEILKEVNLQIKSHEKIVISGESGSGKTTLLKALLGWIPPKKGSITIAGYHLKPENLKEIRSKIFYLPQDIQAKGEETVKEYLEYPFGLKINRALKFDLTKTFNQFNALNLKTDLINQPLYSLSGGEKKRIGLIRGLILARPLFLLDEPTSSVDEANQKILVDHILSLQKITVFAITHDRYFMNSADSHHILKKGRIYRDKSL